MSEALTYLMKARPEAMAGYFKFLKQAGTHLDVKTRDLISVITKVDVQTENGLRQTGLKGGIHIQIIQQVSDLTVVKGIDPRKKIALMVFASRDISCTIAGY